jgi:hypothetical protein
MWSPIGVQGGGGPRIIGQTRPVGQCLLHSRAILAYYKNKLEKFPQYWGKCHGPPIVVTPRPSFFWEVEHNGKKFFPVRLLYVVSLLSFSIYFPKVHILS